MLPFLAQLIAPPLQPGPVRLPGAGQQQTRPATPPQLSPKPETTPLPAAPSTTAAAPGVRGFNPYSPAELTRILGNCLSASDPAAGLTNCTTALSSRLFADGYINSRVIPRPSPPPGVLEVVPGRIETIQVVSSNGRLQRRLRLRSASCAWSRSIANEPEHHSAGAPRCLPSSRATRRSDLLVRDDPTARRCVGP
jgi:hemolysin activation/secretion protein